MKTKQAKEESDKSIDDETISEPKTRARKKASDINDEDKLKNDEAKTSNVRKAAAKTKTIVKKKPIGIRKTLRNKKNVVTKKIVKKVIKPGAKRGRKPAIKPEVVKKEENETLPIIPAAEIKKEPVEELSPNSRSSSPKTAGRRQRLSSDIMMMKSVLADPPSTLVTGPRTSPYAMRSERSQSPSLKEGKILRSNKPRKAKTNLLNEVVMKQQKKRARVLSFIQNDSTEGIEEVKKVKRGRSCSRDGSEISKSSDITESDISLSEAPSNDTDLKKLNKKLDKPKTDLDIDIENSVQISTIDKVPSMLDSKLAPKPIAETILPLNEERKCLKRSTSLDSDNNNGSNRIKVETLHRSLDSDDKELTPLGHDFQDRSRILTSMSKTFNSKEISKNIRKARWGKKPIIATKTSPNSAKAVSTSLSNDSVEEKGDTEFLSKEIDELITNLEQSLESDSILEILPADKVSIEVTSTKSSTKLYGTKPLSDTNGIVPNVELISKEKEPVPTETPSKNKDSENITLHYDENSSEKSGDSKPDISFNKCNVASIDKLMGRLKEFEEFDKRRQRLESENKPFDPKQVMVSNDVVLIPKSGADIKPLKDIQSVRSPEKPLQKENVLSCFENNSAISIVKRDQVRRSVDLTDLPNSVTLIKRNSISRKESTGSNNSKESTDAISIFEKSLGKDVTLTEIRKSVDKTSPPHQVEIHQFATLHPNSPSSNFKGVLDSKQISITPRGAESKAEADRRRLSLSRKSSESTPDIDIATIEIVKSPLHGIKTPSMIATSPIAIKSPEIKPMETDTVTPPSEINHDVGYDITLTATTAEVDQSKVMKPTITDKAPEASNTAATTIINETEAKTEVNSTEVKSIENDSAENSTMQDEIVTKPEEINEKSKPTSPETSSKDDLQNCQAGPSNQLLESPGEQQRKENVLRTLGLLTHKAAKEIKIEKAKEKERIFKSLMQNKNKAKAGTSEYTGTLKTVIKLNRGSGEREKKRIRSSLKMTFQKSKNRFGKPQLEAGEAASDDDTYYTIESHIGASNAADGGQRKSYSNRLTHDQEVVTEPVVEAPKGPTIALVIPEKASSFSIHPGRLCQDQCFYCGGKFGLFDTPCHIAQMKSSDRQKKVLDNEEKLTIDSCLCDACYRHVDRRANCPSYRKRPLIKQAYLQPPGDNNITHQQSDKVLSPPLEDDSEEDAPAPPAPPTGRPAVCHTEGCTAPAENSIRRKWLIKMRSSVNKLLKLEGDYPGLHTIPLCGEHYRQLAPLMSCNMCHRKIIKHHNVHFIHHGYLELNPLLLAEGLPVEFTERPVLCKMCRYYCTLLQRPGHNDKHARTYRRRLLQVYNIEVPPENSIEQDEIVPEEDPNIIKHKPKKAKNKAKQRRSTELEKADSESPEKSQDNLENETTTEDTNNKLAQSMDEDIESLISSNRILVPGANKPSEPNVPHDITEPEMILEIDPIVNHDKQIELQYLLQKQNNPSQFLHKPAANLTQKQRNLMKLQNVSLISKPAQQHRINEKNAKRIHKLGQIITQQPQQKEKERKDLEIEVFDPEKHKDITKASGGSDDGTDPNSKKSADITTLKNKWQMSESFTQVKKNLSELSKNLTVDKISKKVTDLKYSNPVKRLETNPSISVRELFPGEEEMNLQCNIEFNNVKGVMPEGWEKCNTTIQYDVETKRLWTELQQPYGNQSSFLRHLVILEKYFRSGDLVLSSQASPAAANYSDSVQSRIRAFDNVANDAPRRGEPAISLIEFRRQKPSLNGNKSLLKSNQNPPIKNLDGKKIAMPPPSILPKPKSKSEAKQLKSKPLPPELIAISPISQGRKAIQNVLHNIQQLVKGVSASDPTEVAAAPLPPQPAPPPPPPAQLPALPALAPAPPRIITPPKDSDKEKAETTKTDVPKKTKTTRQPWRPRLMTITQENLAKIDREPPQVAVDGRRLPSLVQVMSAGKRYHITLQDYNKMCIMRREKLQQIQEDHKPKKPAVEVETLVTEIQPSALLGNGGTLKQNISTERLPESELPKSNLCDMKQMGNAATILKNVGLKNITIAPIPAKTATVTSLSAPVPLMSSPSLLVTSTPLKLPQLEGCFLAPASVGTFVGTPTTPIIMPKIPKSLTVIPQTVIPQTVMPQTLISQAIVTQTMIGPVPDPGKP